MTRDHRGSIQGARPCVDSNVGAPGVLGSILYPLISPTVTPALSTWVLVFELDPMAQLLMDNPQPKQHDSDDHDYDDPANYSHDERSSDAHIRQHLIQIKRNSSET